MARTRRTQKDKNEDLKEVAKQVAREALLDFREQSEDDGPDEDTISFIDKSNDITEEKSAQDPTGFDIFSDVGEPRTEKGDIIRYVVRKWGQHIATKFHPYSWEEMHEEFGAGNYQVIARSDSTKKFIKSESRILGDPRQASQKKIDDAKEDASSNSGGSGLGFMEMWSLMQAQEQKAKEEARELSRESSNSQSQMMLLVAELIKSNSTNGSTSGVQMMQMITQMMQEQQRTTNQMFEKLADSQTRLFEKINDRIEKVSEKKSNEFDMFNKGMEMFSKMNEMAEKRAQLQLELLEEAKEEARADADDDDDKPKKKSVTDSLIEGVLPVISQALIQNQQGQQNPALVQQQRQLALRQQAIQRRQLQIAAAKRAQANRQVQPRAGAKADGNKVEAQEVTAQVETEVQGHSESGGESSGENILRDRGLPTRRPNLQNPDILDFSDADETELKEVHEVTVKEKCREILPEFLARLMLDQVPPDVAANHTLDFLAEHDIAPEIFLQGVSNEDLLEVAKQYGLPEAAFEWLNELYANIQSQPRDVSGPEFSEGPQPTA